MKKKTTKKTAPRSTKRMTKKKQEALALKKYLKVNDLVEEAFIAAKLGRMAAYAPYSNFFVGAAVVTPEGHVYSGGNVENASYGATVCAERTAIWKAVTTGDKKFTDVVVVTSEKRPVPPCALCLQVMAEFCLPETRIWLGDLEGVLELHEFGRLLTRPFGPSYLGK